MRLPASDSGVENPNLIGPEEPRAALPTEAPGRKRCLLDGEEFPREGGFSDVLRQTFRPPTAVTVRRDSIRVAPCDHD